MIAADAALARRVLVKVMLVSVWLRAVGGVHDNDGKIAKPGRIRKYRLSLDPIARGYGLLH
jgi:hypothetical protein